MPAVASVMYRCWLYSSCSTDCEGSSCMLHIVHVLLMSCSTVQHSAIQYSTVQCTWVAWQQHSMYIALCQQPMYCTPPMYTAEGQPFLTLHPHLPLCACVRVHPAIHQPRLH
jgi:hypothetical protein